MDRKNIEKEAKKILDKFAKSLEKVEKYTKKDNNEYFVDRDEFEREEGNGDKCDGFKELMLENAINKDENFIIAEKGSWN